MALRVIIAALKRTYPKVPVITTTELQHLMKDEDAKRNLIVLDTREKEEYKVSHLVDAVHLHPDETDMSKVIRMIHERAGPPNGTKTVVCYCAVGHRSSIMATRLLDELGKPENKEIKSSIEVKNLGGAIFQWANERKELVDPDGKSTILVNPVSRFWGKLIYPEMRSFLPK